MEAATKPGTPPQTKQGSETDQDPTPETKGQSPTTPAETTPQKRESEYVILVSTDGKTFELAASQNSVTANGQAAARREYVSRNPSGIEELCSQGKLFIAAVPKASWHPTEVRVERPEPRIVA